MCGFAGLIAFADKYRIDRALLQRMSNTIAHRGPDGEGLFLNDPQTPQCALAFRRLAILDLDPRAMQPMTDGHRTLVFNGEIYNFRDLRKELDAHQRYQWKTTGDTEVIFRAYSQWREKCVDHLNGMFAFAIFDKQENSLFLARDRMGQKPLYYAISPDNQAIAFASEMAALRLLDWPDTTVEIAALSGYLESGYIASPATIYRGIRKLPPATTLKFTGKSEPRSRTYFDPNLGGGDIPDIKTAVRDAVNRQLVSDVPVGCFLSGGIDSSVIAAAMQSSIPSGQKILTFSIGFDDPRYDETEFAAAVAAHLGTTHHKFIVRPDAAEDLPKLAAVFGEPFADSSALPTHYLARETRQHVKVALSGDGGDELFGGYDRYRAMHYARRAEKFPPFVRKILSHLPSTHPKSRFSKIRRFARSLHLPSAQRYAQFMSLFDPDQIAHLYTDYQPQNLIELIYEKLATQRDPAQSAAATDRLTYLPEDLLTKVDRASMLHALEVRSPFMDHELVTRCANLTTGELMQGGPKRLLREAFAPDLPPFVFQRPKMGFAIPIGDWLRTTLRPMMYDLLTAPNSFAANTFRKDAIADLIHQHTTRRADHSQRLYALMMLELWHKSANIKT
jgi:asparagine synthase (glutamine-hydrolysing)